MLDPKTLKENPAAVRAMLKRRNLDFPIDDLLNLDRRRRELIVQTQELKHKKNKLAEAVAAKKKARQNADAELAEMKQMSAGLEKVEQERVSAEEQFKKTMMVLPNMLHESVPEGKDEKDNVVVRQAGTIRAI